MYTVHIFIPGAWYKETAETPEDCLRLLATCFPANENITYRPSDMTVYMSSHIPCGIIVKHDP